MKKLIVTTLFLMLCTVFALAQTAGTQSSNPPSQTGTGTSSGSTSSGSQDTMAPSTSQTGNPSTSSGSQDTMGTKSQSQSTASNKSDGKEKKITGCLESAGSGQYALDHKGKKVTVVPSSAVSSEIANHVGHKVKVYGEWEQTSASSASGDSTMASNTGSNLPQSDQPGGTSSTTSGKSKSDKNAAKEFRAEKIEMVSDSCGGGKSSTKSDTTSTPSTPKPY
jgi:hypothetical protein